MFVGLVGLGGTITIALFIKYLFGLYYEMGDCFVFIFLTFTFFLYLDFNLGCHMYQKNSIDVGIKIMYE